MPEKDKTKDNGQLSRRQFIRNAGVVVGGTAIGSTAILVACGNGEDITTTVTKTVSVTTDVAKYISPFDGQEFDTLAELEAHITEKYLEAAPAGLTTLTVNGKKYNLVDLKPYSSLCFVLREKLHLFGTKNGCDRGECGTCTVIMNGKTVYSCLVLAVEAKGATIETVEGQSGFFDLSPLQQKLYDAGAVQCGYCTPGVVMSATALYRDKPNPTLAEVKEGLSGNICTCGNMNNVLDALVKVR